MDDYWVDANQLHQHDIAGKALFQCLVDHGITAILNHYGATRKLLYIRQRLGKYLGDVLGVA